jgi:ABC-2 type transport system permease protein
LGQSLGASTLALLQAVIFLILAPLVGIRLSIGSLLAVFAVLALLAFGLTNLGLMIAWRLQSTQGFHAIMNLMLMPLWLLSGAFFPLTGVPLWLEWRCGVVSISARRTPLVRYRPCFPPWALPCYSGW